MEAMSGYITQLNEVNERYQAGGQEVKEDEQRLVVTLNMLMPLIRDQFNLQGSRLDKLEASRKYGQKLQRLTDSKAALQLKEFKGDKSEFRLWVEKLDNIVSASYLGFRGLTQGIKRRLDQTRKVISFEDVKGFGVWVGRQPRT